MFGRRVKRIGLCGGSGIPTEHMWVRALHGPETWAQARPKNVTRSPGPARPKLYTFVWAFVFFVSPGPPQARLCQTQGKPGPQNFIFLRPTPDPNPSPPVLTFLSPGPHRSLCVCYYTSALLALAPKMENLLLLWICQLVNIPCIPSPPLLLCYKVRNTDN